MRPALTRFFSNLAVGALFVLVSLKLLWDSIDQGFEDL